MQCSVAYLTCICTCSCSSNVAAVVVVEVYLSIYLPASLKMKQSVRTPQLLNVIMSKRKQVCETSSSFDFGNIKNEAILQDSSNLEVDTIKNEAILRDFLQQWKVECRADGLVPMRFATFPFHLSKVLRLPRKSDARSYEVLHLSRKIISANLKI